MVALGAYQIGLFTGGRPAVNVDAAVVRHRLDDLCWVDVGAGWLRGADTLLIDLATRLAWTNSRRRMYDRMVDEPRLSAGCELGGADTPPAIDAMAAEVDARYDERINSVRVNYYRNGADSVAWHSDRVGLTHRHPIVAIVSLGGPRRLLLRPRGGGRSRPFELASGDLLVMGGACQHRWEHAVPKVAAAPPRMSVTFRRHAP